MKLFKCAALLLLSLFALGCQDNPSTKPQPESVTVSDELSQKNEYQGMEEKILEHLMVTEIPDDFPTFRDGETKKEYKIRTMEWAKANLKLIKPQYREKVKNFKEK